MVDNDLMIANKIIVATAAAQSDDGDCDADGFIEPAPWRAAGGAVVSAGPDKSFQTTCRDWLDANTDNEPDNPLIEKTAGSDDYIIKQTYIEAANTGGGQGLWNIKDADANVAEIGKDLEIKDSGGDVNVSISRATGVGDFLGLTTNVITPRNTSTNRIDLDGFFRFFQSRYPR
jgi:hypothetical protein